MPPLTIEQLRDAFGMVDEMVRCNARFHAATDESFRLHLESAISVRAEKVHGYVVTSAQPKAADGIR
jgi:hypothetical protein